MDKPLTIVYVLPYRSRTAGSSPGNPGRPEQSMHRRTEKAARPHPESAIRYSSGRCLA